MTQLPRFDLRPGITETVVLLVSRRAVDAGDVASIASKLKPMLAKREDAWRYRGQMTLVIDGSHRQPWKKVPCLSGKVGDLISSFRRWTTSNRLQPVLAYLHKSRA